MQDRYVGDVGDFGKYALLNSLSGHTLRLGILWYRNAAEEGNQDGKFTDYEDLKECDPVLFRKLKTLITPQKRLLTEVEHGDILPKNALFYAVAVASPDRPCYTPGRRDTQARARKNWFERAARALRPAKLVFLDPDNGIAGNSNAKHHKRSVKYVFIDEIVRIVCRKQSVIVYQHQQRKRLERQISDQRQAFKQYCVNPFALSFHSRSVRIYYVLPANRDHGDVLLQQAAEFASGPWKRCFRLHK